MNQYLRDFTLTKLDTFSILNSDELNEVLNTNKNSQNFTLINKNIRGIRHNLDKLKIFLEQIETDIDCIVLTEPRIVDDIIVFNIAGYKTLYNQGTFNQNDGVIIFVKTEIYSSHEIIKFDNSHLIKLKVNNNNKQIEINALYRSPSDTNINGFIDNLTQRLNEDITNVDFSIYTGDFNINLLASTDATKMYLDVFYEYGYVSAINIPTREKIIQKHVLTISLLNQKIINMIQLFHLLWKQI